MLEGPCIYRYRPKITMVSAHFIKEDRILASAPLHIQDTEIGLGTGALM